MSPKANSGVQGFPMASSRRLSLFGDVTAIAGYGETIDPGSKWL